MWSINKTCNLKKIMLLSIAIIMTAMLCPYMAKGDLCYQETANESYESDGSCSLDYSGLYLTGGDSWQYTENLYDGNWTTYAIGGAPSYLYINYTKPYGALNSSLWKVNDTDGDLNLTIPSACWSQYSDKLSFRLYGSNDADVWSVQWACYEGSWNTLRSIGSEGGGEKPYEEAMWWNVTTTCSCPGADQNWEIDMNENCIIESDCDIGIGNLTFTNSGNVSIGYLITTANMGIPPADSIIYINGSGKITITS